MIVQAFTEPGDKIIVQPPVYFPFFSCVENNGRTLVVNRLAEDRGVYSIDFDDLERKMKEGARMLILCNPHNPVSRCWTREELEWVGRKCLEYGILVVSDEIHCDLVFSPHRHIPMATLSPEIEKITVTCIAPSKTFNLAGLFTSSIIITDEDLRRRFKTSAERIHLSPNIFGIVAAEAAYREGDQWLAELMGYLEGNIRKVGEFLARSMPGVTFSPPEATYMLWLDFRTLGLGDEELKDRLINEAGLGLVDGRIFGAGGAGFQRMNIGCPAAVVETALERLKKV
jgi:cystathionine beta-lyase